MEQRTQYVHQLVPDGIHEGMIRKADTWSGQVKAMKAAITTSTIKLGEEQAVRLDKLEEMMGEIRSKQQDTDQKLDRTDEKLDLTDKKLDRLIALLESTADRSEQADKSKEA